MAKGMIAEFLVKVGSAGLGKTKKDVDDLANSTDNVGRAHTRTAEAARMHFDTQAKGVIGTANSTKSFSKMAQTMNSGGGVVGAYATLAANIFAVSAAFNALRSAAQVQQVEKGLEALGARTGQTLTVAAEGLREITGNTISMEQSMRSAAQVFSAGFGTKELERIGSVANDVSVALGRNMTDSMDRLTRGIIKLEPELLDELGLMTRLGEATKIYSVQTGKTEAALSTAERRQAFLNAVLTEGELKFGGLSKVAGNTRGYDTLAAALADLSKVTLNFINTGMLPLVNLFAQNPTAIAGGAILFASTLKDQLLPGMTDMAQKSSAVAEDFKKMTKLEIDEVINLNTDTNGKSLNALSDKIKAETATLADYQNTQVILAKEQETYQKKIEKYEKRGTGNSTDTQTASYKANLTAVQDLTDKRRELNDVIFATQRANVETTKSEALLAASTGNTAKALDLSRKAGGQYYDAMLAAGQGTNTLSRGMLLARASALSFATSMKVVGASILTALPYIGIIAIAIGGAIALIKSLQSEEDKLKAKKAEEFSKVFVTLADKLKQLEAINKSNASVADRTAAALKVEMNSIVELADRYKALREAKMKAATDENNGGGISKWYEILNSERDSKSKLYQVAKSSPAFDAAASGASKEEVQMLDALNRVAPEAFNNLVRVNGGMDKFSELAADVQATKVDATFQTLADKARIAAAAIESYTLANKEAGTALDEFNRASLPKTGYDKAVTGLNSLNNSIRGLGNSSAVTKTEVANMLSGLAAGVKSNLSVEGAKFISDYQEISRLEQTRVTNGGTLTTQQEEQLRLANQRLAISGYTTESLAREIQQMNVQFIRAQEMEISLKNQNALLNARLKINQDVYNTTTVGLQKQMELENQVIQNQVAQLRIQRDLSANQVRQGELKVIELENQRETIRLEHDLLVLRQRAYNDTIDQAIALKTIEAESSRGNLIAYAEIDRVLTRMKDLKQTNLDNFSAREVTYAQEQVNAEINIANAREANRIASLNIAAIDNDILATSMATLSAEQMAAKIREKSVQINNARAAKYDEILSVVNQIDDVEGRRSELARSGNISMAYELRAGRERVANARNLAKAESDRQIAAMEATRNDQAVQGNDRGAQEAAVAHWNTEISYLQTAQQARDQLLVSQQSFAELEMAIFDTRSQGLEWQRDSLNLLQQQVSAQSELGSSGLELLKTQEDLARKRMGLGDRTRTGEQAEEIRVARYAYEQARDGAEVKKSLIELEFTLLEAQQTQLMSELRTRKAILQGQNEDGRYDVNIAQIDRVVGNIQRIDFSAIIDANKQIVDNNVQALRNNLITATTNSSQRINSAFYDRARLLEEQRAAQLTIATNAVAPATRAVVESVVEPLTTSQDLLMESQGGLIASLDELRETLETLKVERTAEAAPRAANDNTLGGMSGSAGQMVTQVGRWLQNEGLRVSEQRGFGGVTPGVHSGRGHDEGRAIDVNVGTGNVEWDNPAMRAQFTALDQRLTEAFGDAVKVLWGPAERHLNHMHIEFKQGFERQAEVMQIIARQPQPVTVTNLDEVMTAPDVLVNAVRPETNLVGESIGQVENSNFRIPVADPSKYSQVVAEMVRFEELAGGITQHFAKLGPAGEVMIAAVEGISLLGRNLQSVQEAFKTGDKTQQFTAMAQTASDAVATIQTAYASAAAAKIEGIDKEIAAEQKRDGKSAESVAKIAALEKKKDSQARKSFEVNKKLQMAQAVIATASAVAQSLAMGGYLAIPLALAVGALGAAQLAIIAGTSYQSSASATTATPASNSTLSIGKRGDSVDLAKNNSSAGGEIGYLRGQQGRGNNASNYSVIGSAYGGDLPRGYGNTAFAVGEHGPEIITPDTTMTVRPMSSNDNTSSAPQPINFNINTLDASGVEDILIGQRGNMIRMLREAANANGQSFLENVNTNVYTKPNVGRL